MFDYVKCEYPLPVPEANDLEYQTKSMDNFMDQYLIKADGSLWVERCDREDQSDAALWERAHPGEVAPPELDRLCGCMARVNKRWEPLAYTGEIRFYDYDLAGGLWLEWSAYFFKGRIQLLHRIEHEDAPCADEEF